MKKVKLIDAPIGLFLYHGIMVLKTEYSTVNDSELSPDCYLVGSGEYFWGGVNTAKERNNLMVTPIKVNPVVHERWVHDRYEDCTEQFEIVKCSNCGFTAYAMAVFVKGGNYCPNCGAKMDGKENDE